MNASRTKAGPADDDCLWRDSGTGLALTYGDLRSRVGGDEAAWHPWVRPATPGEAVLAVLGAVVLGRELTLVDADFSTEEARAAGATAERLAERVRVPGRHFGTAAAMVAALRAEWAALDSGSGPVHEGGFRLTLFTSGSTGLPKQVTHGLAGLSRMVRLGERHESDVWGLAYNATHIAGVQVILQAFFNGNTLVQLFGREPVTAWRTIKDEGITHLSATPSFYRLLLGATEAGADGAAPVEACGVRAVTLGGERCDAGLRARLAARFPAARIRNVYASTEAGSLFVAEGEVFSVPPGLAGRVRIVSGELQVAAGLLGDFGGGAEAIRDGWYRTGDTVELVSEEPLSWRILSRDRDWVNVGGHKVNPAEVEAVLLAYPGVAEARVHGRANSVLGQILVAEVVAAAAPDEVELRTFLSARLQAAKVPRLIKCVEQIARGRTGKQAAG
jgi:acyl-coenzyme A synthetase/AMP-(fatty) acid ligase